MGWARVGCTVVAGHRTLTGAALSFWHGSMRFWDAGWVRHVGSLFGGLQVALMAGIAWVDAVEAGDGIGVGDARLSRSD